MTRLAPVLVALLSFTGCSLIDQRTFAPAPEAKAQPAQAPAATAERLDARTPLVTIEYAGAPPDYAEMLNYAVRAAETRYPDVQYDVVSVVKDASEARAGQERAVGVMRAIMRDRVPESRIHLGLRTEPGVETSQVRVYVR